MKNTWDLIRTESGKQPRKRMESTYICNRIWSTKYLRSWSNIKTSRPTNVIFWNQNIWQSWIIKKFGFPVHHYNSSWFPPHFLPRKFNVIITDDRNNALTCLTDSRGVCWLVVNWELSREIHAMIEPAGVKYSPLPIIGKPVWQLSDSGSILVRLGQMSYNAGCLLTVQIEL